MDEFQKTTQDFCAFYHSLFVFFEKQTMSGIYQQQKGFDGSEVGNAIWEKLGYNGWESYPNSISFLIEKEWKNGNNITKYNPIYYQNNNGNVFIIDLIKNIETQLNSNNKGIKIRRISPKINVHLNKCPNCHFTVNNETQNECDICDINIQKFLLNQFKKQKIANNPPINPNNNNIISNNNNNKNNSNNNSNIIPGSNNIPNQNKSIIKVANKPPKNNNNNNNDNNKNSSQIFCPKCNNACKSTFKFCPSCGNDIRHLTINNKQKNNINNDNNIPGCNINNIIDLTLNSDNDISMSYSNIKEPGQSSDNNESYMADIE